MDKTTLDKLCRQIYKQFPIVQDKNPVVSKQGNDRYLLVFSSSGKTPDGKTIQHQIRVVATEAGQILKSSMSR
jgi:hypothetical protein